MNRWWFCQHYHLEVRYPCQNMTFTKGHVCPSAIVVCVSVHIRVHQSRACYEMTWHPFKPESPNTLKASPLFATRFAACAGGIQFFHAAASLLKWYKMTYMEDILHRLIGMKFISMLSMYVQSGTGIFITELLWLLHKLLVFGCLWISLVPPNSSGNIQRHMYFLQF